MKIASILSVITLLITSNSQSQIISQFTWDGGSVLVADIGPDATSVSGSAISDINGVGGTNGLNPSLPKADLNMMIPGSPVFDIDGIDVSFDFQRDESVGQFFERKPGLAMNGSANLSVTYRVDDGFGGITTIASGNVYAIPNDNIFRNYRFYYLPDTGEGVLMVDGVEVWSNDGPDGYVLDWSTSGDVEFGRQMDGSGSDRTIFDNLIVASVTGSPLPIELISFNAILTHDIHPWVTCKWITLSESDNDYFLIEHSADGINWYEVGTVDGAGNSSQRIEYQLIDHNPLPGVSYYRLTQFDFNGESSNSEIRSVSNFNENGFTVYPNPSNGQIFITGFDHQEELSVQVFNALGQVVLESHYSNADMKSRLEMNVDSLNPGVYFVKVNDHIERLIID